MPAGPDMRSAALAAALLALALPGCKQVSGEAERAAQKALAEQAAQRAAKAQAAQAVAGGSQALREAGKRIVEVGGHHAFVKSVDEVKEKSRDPEPDEKLRTRLLTARPKPPSNSEAVAPQP